MSEGGGNLFYRSNLFLHLYIHFPSITHYTSLGNANIGHSSLTLNKERPVDLNLTIMLALIFPDILCFCRVLHN